MFSAPIVPPAYHMSFPRFLSGIEAALAMLSAARTPLVRFFTSARTKAESALFSYSHTSPGNRAGVINPAGPLAPLADPHAPTWRTSAPRDWPSPKGAATTGQSLLNFHRSPIVFNLTYILYPMIIALCNSTVPGDMGFLLHLCRRFRAVPP